MNNKLKILISDKSALTSVTLANKLCEKDVYAYTRQRDCNILTESIKKDSPDVAVINVSEYVSDITSMMKKLKELNIRLPVFIITSEFNSEFVMKQMLENGASVFLPEPYNADDICNAISSVLKGKADNLSSDIEKVVTDMIRRLGIPAHIKGYHYLRTSILFSFENRSLLNSVTKFLYPAVAEVYDTTPERVEKNILNAVKMAWRKENTDALRYLFGYIVDLEGRKPTSPQFISLVTDILHLKYKPVSKN